MIDVDEFTVKSAAGTVPNITAVAAVKLLPVIVTLVPPKVEPGALAGQPPSDATLLFNGRDLSGWERVNGGAADWAVENGEMVIRPKSGSA